MLRMELVECDNNKSNNNDILSKQTIENVIPNMAPHRRHHQGVLRVQLSPKTDSFVQGQHTSSRKNHATKTINRTWTVSC